LPDFGDGGVDVGLVDDLGNHLFSLAVGFAAYRREFGFGNGIFVPVFHEQCEEGPDRVDQEEDDRSRANGEEHDAAAHDWRSGGIVVGES